MRELTITLLFFLAIPLVTNATIYKFYDEDGNVVFADQPGPDAEVIEEREIQTIKSQRTRPTTKLTDPDQKKKAFTYKELKITNPVNDEAIRNNIGDINVDVSVKPQLRQKLGHKLVLLLDGKPVSEPGTATGFALHEVNRGQHSIAARIIDKAGKTIMTAKSVTIHLKRFSQLNQKSQKTIQPVPIPKPKPNPQPVIPTPPKPTPGPAS